MKRALKILAALLIVAVIALAVAISHDSACPTSPSPALAAGSTPMKAAVYRCYGPPEVVKIEDVAKPVPGDEEVLVKVHAAGVNPLDWHYMRGVPYIMRLESGFCRPKDQRLGVDFSGTVEAVGKSVTSFKPGDEVFGGRNGAFAEYVVVNAARNIQIKPARITFEQAAGVPIAAVTALQALRDKGELAGRAEGADQRRLGRRGHVRRADREGVRCGGDRRRAAHATSSWCARSGPIT